jgi:OOP family OmpA-OmpF porin
VKRLLVVLLVGCAGSQVRTQTTATDGVIASARDNGAQKCAPVELAMAESHNDYAEHALDEGNYYDAKREAEVAEKNAKLAFDHSPREKCVPKKAPPKPGDRDGDGLTDDVDKCPDEPEDKDGFEDDDGCPDPDNDKDSILDKDDKCPNEPGVPPDGCPQKYKLVVVTEKKIELKQTVFFDTNKATIKPVSFPLLTEVAQAMKDNPKIKVEVQGHTDSVGNDAFNLKLSQKRAESVRNYLIKKGISSDRMAPKGYGENVPIADNRTKAGRDQNRRVEFVITER